MKLSTTLTLLGALLASQAAFAGQTTEPLIYRGTTQFAASPSATQETGLETRPSLEVDASFERLAKGTTAPARVPAAHVPRPADSAFAGVVANAGFDGLTHRDQRLASGGNNFSLEPPDQALAVGNGFVLEAVNTALRVRTTGGGVAMATVSLNEFFNLAPAILRSTPPVYGPFTTDPKAYYDADTQRFFVTMLAIDQDPATGDLLPHSAVHIAVSDSADPTGTWKLYEIETTDVTGTPAHAGCPCFGDQPLIGADRYGFYVSTNEFPLFEDGFNGAQVYAMSKARLVAGVTPTIVHFDGLPLAEGPAYTLQPAITAQGGAHASANNGTEYFLSALDFDATLDNRIAVWALTNSASLDAAVPDVKLTSAVLPSQVYGQPPDAQQRPGPTPLADLIKADPAVAGLLKAGTQKLTLIAANDDRMQQVTWADGKLWSSLNSVVKPDNGPVRSGGAYFVVAPSFAGGALGGSIVRQGYVSLSNHSVLFPSVGVNKDGKGVIAFSIVGDAFYPSVGYAPIDATQGAGAIHLVALGAAPADGFTGYAAFGGRTERWGDYSAAVADADGRIWFADEYIPDAPRTTLANWGTFIGNVMP
jgi:hypothetical protein